MSNTLNVSSEDARKVKKSVIFFCDKKIWLKGICLTAKYMEGVCKYFVNKTETPSFFAVFAAI